MRKLVARRIAIILILVFVFGSAIFLYFFALKVDRKYSDLILIETENTENINKIAYNLSCSRLVLTNTLYSPNNDSTDRLQQEWESYISRNSIIFDTLSKKIFLPEKSRNELYNISKSGGNYAELSKALFALKHHTGSDSCRYFLRTRILPAYKIYLDQLTKLLELNNKKLLAISEQLIIENKNTGLIYLSLGVSPFAFLIIYLAFGLLLLFYLLFLSFRHDKT